MLEDLFQGRRDGRCGRRSRGFFRFPLQPARARALRWREPLFPARDSAAWDLPRRSAGVKKGREFLLDHKRRCFFGSLPGKDVQIQRRGKARSRKAKGFAHLPFKGISFRGGTISLGYGQSKARLRAFGDSPIDADVLPHKAPPFFEKTSEFRAIAELEPLGKPSIHEGR